MIVVTGAIGQGVIDGLHNRRRADQIIASVRDPAKAASFAEEGIQVHADDFTKPN